MIILILGGQGNLGSQLTKTLLEDYEVVSWDRDDLDVLDFQLLASRVQELKPQVIINTVAYNNVDACENKNEYELAFRLNCELPAGLADLARSLDCLLVHYSSDYVFNGTVDKKEFVENNTSNAINKYGESKFFGEIEILKRAERGLKYYLIRTSKLFGPRGISLLAKPSFFDIMLNLAQNKKDLTVVNEELSCFTYTPDLARATERLIATKAPWGIYHLVNDGACTWYDGVMELFRLKKIKANVRPVRSEDLARPARRPKFSVLINTRVKKLRPWKEALREYLNN